MTGADFREIRVENARFPLRHGRRRVRGYGKMKGWADDTAA